MLLPGDTNIIASILLYERFTRQSQVFKCQQGQSVPGTCRPRELSSLPDENQYLPWERVLQQDVHMNSQVVLCDIIVRTSNGHCESWLSFPTCLDWICLNMQSWGLLSGRQPASQNWRKERRCWDTPVISAQLSFPASWLSSNIQEYGELSQVHTWGHT